MFGTIHIAALIASAALIALGIIFSRRLSLRTVTVIMFVIGIISEIIKVFTFTVWNEARLGGYLPKTDLPFHLCSVQIIFLAILVLSRNKKLHRILYSFMLPTCLVGALGALLIPTVSSVGRVCTITFQYFIYHSALIVFAVKLITTRELIFTVRDYLTCLAMLLGTFFVAIYVNSILYDGESAINFMYVVGPPREGLPYLNKDNGWLSYILRYGLLCIVVVTLTHIKPIVKAIAGAVKARREAKN